MYAHIKQAREIIWATNWSVHKKKSVYGQIKGLEESEIKTLLAQLGLCVEDKTWH